MRSIEAVLKATPKDIALHQLACIYIFTRECLRLLLQAEKLYPEAGSRDEKGKTLEFLERHAEA